MITTKQYRYLSPVILYGKSNSVIAALSSVALTNRPNLHLQALNQHGDTGGQVHTARALNADEQKICHLLGVSEEEYLKAELRDSSANNSSEMAGGMSDDERQICRLLGISEEEYMKTAS